MPINNFKSDDSFLRNLAIGATGTNATITRLQELGYQPIELERGSSGYKVWKEIKIKRVRVPDILCLKSGQRFEARGKTTLEISMSHSLKDHDRAWDAEMRDDDYVALVRCKQIGDSPTDWDIVSPVHFITIASMRQADRESRVKISVPKGVNEGSEIRKIWPCATANRQSRVIRITETRIDLVSCADNISQRCFLKRKGIELIPQCNIGDIVEENQIIASIVPIILDLPHPEDIGEEFFINRIQNLSLSERYASAKALRYRRFTDKKIAEQLVNCIYNNNEYIYVKLEAAAALAAHGIEEGWEFLEQSSTNQYSNIQLETVIVASEIDDPRSETLLISVLANQDNHHELRAAAAWCLGKFHTDKSASALVSTFDSATTEIKQEAAQALLKLAPKELDYIINLFKSGVPEQRDGLAWTLARSKGVSIIDLLQSKTHDDHFRRWVSYIVGYSGNNILESQLSELRTIDPEVHFSASVLWQILSSWIYGLEEY